MKKLFYVVLISFISTLASGQHLLELYKNGTISLVPDTEYAQGNEWNKVFETYYDTIYNRPMGNRKSLIVLPDGSVIINHAYQNYYSKFSPEGKFQKEFGIVKSNGSKFKKTERIAGVLNNNRLFSGLDNLGNMICSDLDGRYEKTLKLNYMTRDMIALPNGKIAVVGWVIWKTKFRDFVAIVDYETNEEKVIWEHFTDRNDNSENSDELYNYTFNFEKQGAISFTTMPFSKYTGIKQQPKLACMNNQLIIVNPTNGELQTFDLNGNLISKKQLEFTSSNISVAEQKEIQTQAIEKFKNLDPKRYAQYNKVNEEESIKAHEYLITAMKNDLAKIKNPIKKPSFSTMLQDSDNNLLFFEFTDETNSNAFNVWVYSNGDELQCKSSFVCDNYELQINPDKIVFHKGYIYSLQNLKNTEGVPLRLTRFKLTN